MSPGIPPPNSTTSFWHSTPSSFLHNHRTTPDLPATTDILVIGSGISGASVVRNLYSSLHPAPQIVLIEAREACWGATGRNGGHCKPALYAYSTFNESVNSVGVDQTLKSIYFQELNLRLLKEYAEAHAQDLDCEFRVMPSCDAYFNHEQFDFAVKSISALRVVAPDIAARLRIVRPDTEEGRKELSEELRVPTAVGAVTFEAGSLWPYKMVAHMLESAIKDHGLNLQTHTPAISLSRSSTTDGSGKKWIVSTPRGDILAEKVIFATNAHTAQLLPVFEDYVYPVRGQMSALIPPKSLREKPLTHTYGLAHKERKMAEYLIQRPQGPKGEGGELMFGGGRFLEKDHGIGLEDGEVGESVAGYLRNAISAYFTGETGYPEDDNPTKKKKKGTPEKTKKRAASSSGEVDKVMTSSLVERFKSLTLSAMGSGHHFWDSAEGFGFDEDESESNQKSDHQDPTLPPPLQSSDYPTPQKECTAKYEWTGVMGYSKDNHPFVGPVPSVSPKEAAERGIEAMPDTDGLWVLAGFAGHGMAYTMGCAKALVQMMLLSSPIITTASSSASSSASSLFSTSYSYPYSKKNINTWFPASFETTRERLGLSPLPSPLPAGQQTTTAAETSTKTLDSDESQSQSQRQRQIEIEMERERDEIGGDAEVWAGMERGGDGEWVVV